MFMAGKRCAHPRTPWYHGGRSFPRPRASVRTCPARGKQLPGRRVVFALHKTASVLPERGVRAEVIPGGARNSRSRPGRSHPDSVPPAGWPAFPSSFAKGRAPSHGSYSELRSSVYEGQRCKYKGKGRRGARRRVRAPGGRKRGQTPEPQATLRAAACTSGRAALPPPPATRGCPRLNASEVKFR